MIPRLGVVPVTESSVIIAVSSVHRRESLEAVSFLIDELKANVPIWKKEIYNNGNGDWKKNKECQWVNSKSPETETKVDTEETCSGKSTQYLMILVVGEVECEARGLSVDEKFLQFTLLEALITFLLCLLLFSYSDLFLLSNLLVVDIFQIPFIYSVGRLGALRTLCFSSIFIFYPYQPVFVYC